MRLAAGALAAGALATAALAAAPRPACAQTFLTQEEALRLAFPPPADVERRTAFLTDAQRAEAGRRAGTDLATGIVTYYVGRGADGAPLGAAWFDVHRVRTLPEAVMVVAAPDGTVRRIEVLKFAEPPEYVAPERWLAQFDGRPLDGDLALKRGIVNLTGATLTSRAVTDAVRRALALQAVLAPFAGPGPSVGPGPPADAGSPPAAAAP
ncbi:MAG: FMN-binding protein [Gemmatimonadota bacterium]|nr:FMN-binding protein [Gemmatimonadota bacterium]